ncbi:hypothetical protein HispidOSU_007954 [Sigmodon hispidus]
MSDAASHKRPVERREPRPRPRLPWKRLQESRTQNRPVVRHGGLPASELARHHCATPSTSLVPPRREPEKSRSAERPELSRDSQAASNVPENPCAVQPASKRRPEAEMSTSGDAYVRHGWATALSAMGNGRRQRLSSSRRVVTMATAINKAALWPCVIALRLSGGRASIARFAAF